MMKKLCTLFMLCAMNIVHADKLSDAIRASDVEAVQEYLQANHLNETNKEMLFAITDEIINMRREEIISAHRTSDLIIPSSRIWGELPPKWYELLYFCAAITTMGVAQCQLFTEQTNDIPAFLRIAILGKNVSLFTLGCSMYSIYAFSYKLRFLELIKTRYNHALDIKILLMNAYRNQNPTATQPNIPTSF